VSASEETVISADRLGRRYLADLWRHRELFVFLAWRDLLVRYKQTVAGLAWSIVRPLLTMLILTLVFSKLGSMPSLGAPYPLLVLCGVLPWQFVSTALAEGGNSLVANTGLISKVYFPRLLIPAATLLTALVDFFICLVLLMALLFWYRWLPPATVLWLPLFMLAACALSFSIGVWISALMVRYRDVRFIVPFVVQFGLYISPVGFLSSVVPDRYQLLYSLNPVVAIIDGFRWCILGGDFRPHFPSVVALGVSIVVLFSTGIWYFRKTERTFADVI
jgi:lipopolysaccharide transport system permease protein